MRCITLLALVVGAAAVAPIDIDANRIRGLMVAVYTPMTPDGLKLDLTKIPAYAKMLKARNITNIMPAGTNGESLSLTVPERKALAEAWAAAAEPLGQRVYMHIGSESLVETIELAAHSAATKGIHGMVSMTPVYFKPTLDSLHQFLAAVGAAAPNTPFWYYHFPDDTAVLPGKAYQLLDSIDKKGDIPNFMGIKFTDYNLMDFSLCVQTGHAGKYNMLYGRDEQAIPALLLGAEAGVSSTINYAPSLRDAVNAWFAGDHVKALAMQAVNAHLCSFFGAFASDLNPQKEMMKMVGLEVGPSRLPKVQMTPQMYNDFYAKLTAEHLLDKPLAEALTV